MTHRRDVPAVSQDQILPQLSRRGLLGAAIGGAVAVSFGVTGCSSDSSAGPGSGDGKVNRPTYVPGNIPPPDHPPTAVGNDAAYVNFPKTFTKSVAEKPSSGGEVTGMILGTQAPPTPVERNSAWQQLNAALGTDLKLTTVAQADYAAKWGTVTAGNDLPDLMYISVVPRLPNVYAFLNAKCADLTPFIGGDAVKEYANLANLNSESWSAGIFEGNVWGVPITRSLVGYPMYVQTSLLEKLGMAGDYPTNADEFKSFCKELTAPSQGRWALGFTNDTTTGPYSMYWFQGMFRAPTNWRLNSDGTLVKDIETDEYKAAVAYVSDLVRAGYVSPDLKANGELTNDLFGDRIVMRSQGWQGYQVGLTDQAATLNKTFRVLPPFGHDGGSAGSRLTPASFGFVAFKKSGDERIKELLRVVNYLCAPFGTDEYMVTRLGVKDQDWKFNDKGSPVFTPQGAANLNGGANPSWNYLGSAPYVLFSRYVPEFANYAYEEAESMLDPGVQDPTLGFYSQTSAERGVQLDQLIADRVSGIAAGRASINDFDDLVRTWKSQGGDRMRDELQKAISGAR